MITPADITARRQGSRDNNRYRLAAVFLAGERFDFAGERFAALRLRVAAAFFAERDRSAAERAAEALPPVLPPRPG